MAREDVSPSLDGIAIVGMAGRFPAARTCEEFWQNLRDGREGLTFFSDEELAAAGCALDPRREKRVRSRGVVAEAELFDAAFFGYSPKEAAVMDPQQRLFLEVAWRALENAGFDPDRVPGAVGVFAGASINTYYPSNVVSRPDVLGSFGVFPAVVLNEKDFLATRVAYKLNLRGPALSVQTACSTSLVVVCNACQSLLSFECDLALAGGVSLNFPQCHSHIHEDGGMISTDGHCRPFDRNATGTLFSDGVGVVALRRLEDAVAAGDTILAVIKGFALNNDGSDKAGFTAPSVNGQARVVQMAQTFGNVAPESISYIEAHGTATPLGDPIEIAALTQAFRAGTDRVQYCAIGSVKSNIGHLDAAAGIAGLIKTVLALQHREIPPTLHFTGPNPKIDFTSSPFFVADKLLEWETPSGVPRRAGVSSFGIGGTNAHVVLEQAPDARPSGPSRPCQLLLLSARSAAAVDTATVSLFDHLKAHPELPLADVAHTLQVGRHVFNHRRAVVCRDRDDAIARLAAEQAKNWPILKPARHDPPVVFMFPGQGAQRVHMGRELYETEPLYRETIDHCARVLTAELGLDLREVLFPQPDAVSSAEQQIVQTRITQPALFVTEYALGRLWMSWGIRPTAMIGHSVGEYVAACLAGVFSLEDGLRLIAARGRLIQQQPAGSMLAVMAGEADVRPLLGEGVSIAAVNAPTLCVASGPHEAIEALEKRLEGVAAGSRRLQTSHAFHSEMMAPVVAPFTELLQGIRLSQPRLPFVSNLTAAWITDDEATSPAYWAQHLRQAVRFADGVAVILGKAEQVLLEVGPGAGLTTLSRQHPAKKPVHVIVPSLPGGHDQSSNTASLLGALGRLWQAGVEVDWTGFHGEEPRCRVPLPGYPFERKRFFVEPGQTESATVVADENTVRAPEPVGPAPETAVVPASRRERIVARLHETLHTLSGLSADEMGSTTTFLEMGFDSLFLSQVSRALEIEFGVPITFRQVADDLSSVSRLADYLEATLSGDVNVSGEATAPARTTVAAAVPAPAADRSELAEIRAQLQVLNRQVESLTHVLLAGKASGVEAISSAPADGAPEVDTFLPMTDAQREVWLAAQLGDDVSRTYNEAYLIRVRGALQADILRASLQELVDRHDALRATFAPDGTGQTIAARLQVDLAVSTPTRVAEDADAERQLDELVSAATTEVFDLAVGPLFRFRLFRVDEQNHGLLLVIHHLVADGWSWAVILQELGEVYTAKAEGRALPERPALQYRDYVAWAGSPSQRARAVSAEAYWLELLADKPEVVELPTDRPWPPRKTYGSGRVCHAFDANLVQHLKDSARGLNCTVFHLLIASFNAWLHRVTGREDLVVAVPMAGQVAAGLREQAHADRLVGHCVNMLPVRMRCAGDASFRDFLQHVKTRMLDAGEHQAVSFSTLIGKLRWPRDQRRVPLASMSLNLGRAHRVAFGGLATDTGLPPKAFNFFDLTADLLEGEGGLTVDCKFNADLCDSSTVARWLAQWERMLAAAVRNPDTCVGDLDILNEDESRRLLVEWNATGRDFPREACLHDLVEQQVRRTPDKVAVACGETTLTYAELDRRSTRLAHHLRGTGVRRGVLVGLFVDRSVDMVVGMLGILKAGAAYVPMDPAFPTERLGFMVQDAAMPVIVTQSALRDNLPRHEAQIIGVDEDWPEQPGDLRENGADASDLAYTIFTSGSTGRPKGVQIPHRAVVNFLNSMRREPGIDQHDVLLSVTTLSFDIAALELFLPLTTGARVVVATRDTAMDGVLLREELRRCGATLLQATPATYRLLLEADWVGDRRLRILCGGEPLPRDLAARLLPMCAELWNMYGPTETTIWSTCCRVVDANDIHIGRPIDNTQLYVVDAGMRLRPVGVAGELLIGGDGLAVGYLERPDLTTEKFVPDPFSGRHDARLYRTGDLARWRSDGNLECLGRIDHQVKIRGFRIELGEIEAVLAQQPAVRQAVVTVRNDDRGESQLVAYVVMDESPKLVSADLRNGMRSTLPDYMIPNVVVQLDRLPLTANGKIDRKVLPAPERSGATEVGRVQPRNETEQRLASIFADTVGAEVVGVNESFFDLGGHSLLGVKLMARIEREFGKRLPLASLFSAPTVGDLAPHLMTPSHADVAWSALVPINVVAGKPALFLVHGAGGNVLLYRELARVLAPDVSTYGFQSLGLDRRSRPLDSVEEMAAHYLRELREFQPNGPYHLGGYCMGGVVAYEMARILREQGVEVGTVAMLDSYNLSRVPSESRSRGFSAWRQKVRFHFDNLRRLNAHDVSGYLIEKMRMADEGGRGRIRTSIEKIRNAFNGNGTRDGVINYIQKVNDRAAWAFRPRPCDGRVTLFKPEKNYDFMPDPELGWGDVVRTGPEVVELPVNPHAMLIEPFVRQLGRELRSRIHEATAASVV